MVDVGYRGRVFHFQGIAEDDHIVRVMAKSKAFYEADLLTYIESIENILPAGIAVDVGANIGNHSTFLATFVRPVIAIEPNPEVLGLLERNLEANGVRARIVAKALGAASTRGTVVVADQRNLGNAHIETGSGDIEVTIFDEVCAGEQVALVKVDVEGMELEVLRGAVETLRRCQPHLFLEAATRKEFHELKEFLHPFGYRPVVRWCYTPTWHFAPNPSVGLIVWARWKRMVYRLLQPIRDYKTRMTPA